MKLTFVHLDYAVVASKYHHSLREFTQWLCSKEDMIEGFGSLEGDGDKYKKDPMLMRQIVSSSVTPAMITNDPRKLYEFFDDHNIRISITEHPDSTDQSPLFTYHNSVIKNSSTAPDRHTAEQSAFMDAFSILEKQIKKE